MKIKKNKERASFFVYSSLMSRTKADMSSKMLVTFILLIAGFVLILLVYSRIGFEGLSSREVCHQSVVLRGTLPETLGIQEVVPLNCKTEKVCVRADKFFGKGECEEFENVKDKINYADVKSTEDIEKLISDQIVDCWSMTGKGELSLFSEGWAASYGLPGSSIHSSCVICSRVVFDKKTLEEKGIDASKRDVLGYMKTHKIPNGDESYYSYLLGGKAGISDDVEIDKIEITNPDTGEKVNLDVNELTKPTPSTGTEELAVLFMQISASSGEEVFSKTLKAFGMAGTATVAVSPVKSVSRAISVARKCVGPQVKVCLAIGAVVGIAALGQQYVASENREIAAAHCGDTFVGDKIGQGCSIVRTVEYNLEDLKQYCGVIESIP